MLSIKLRKLFTKWRLYERESFFDTIICYEQENVVRIERRFNNQWKKDNREIHNFIFDLYFEYEWQEWISLTARQIALLLWTTHNYVDNCLKRIQLQMKDRLEYTKINQKKKIDYKPFAPKEPVS